MPLYYDIEPVGLNMHQLSAYRQHVAPNRADAPKVCALRLKPIQKSWHRFCLSHSKHSSLHKLLCGLPTGAAD